MAILLKGLQYLGYFPESLQRVPGSIRTLQRLVNAALNGYFHDLYEQIATKLPPEVQTQLDQLLVVPPDGVVSRVPFRPMFSQPSVVSPLPQTLSRSGYSGIQSVANAVELPSSP
jgi:hypothetical protein